MLPGRFDTLSQGGGLEVGLAAALFHRRLEDPHLARPVTGDDAIAIVVEDCPKRDVIEPFVLSDQRAIGLPDPDQVIAAARDDSAVHRE